MSAPKMNNRRVMPLAEREEITREIQLAEREAAGDIPELSREMKKHVEQDSRGGRSSYNDRHLSRMKAVLRAGEPDSLSPQAVTALEKEAKVLEEWLSKRMLTRKQVQARPMENGVQNSNFRRYASELAKQEHSADFLAKAHRLKNIRRQLQPDDPTAGNIEYLRAE